MNLQTDRILLKIVEKSDAKNIHKVRTNPQVSKYIKRDLNKTLQDIEEFIEDRKKINFLYTITTLDKNEFAGTIVLWNIDYDKKYAELGYELLPEFQNKGIMSNAINAVLDYAFNSLDFEYIEAYTHKENKNSRKLLEKKGFHIVENKIDQENLDNVIYGINKPLKSKTVNQQS